jgi:Na+-translocating ferredoxin:NAD+ oxidoreductase subunit B
MADRSLVAMRKVNGKDLYELLPFIPGITELVFISGLVDQRSRNVLKLLTEYIEALEKMAASAPPSAAAPSDLTRKISVEEEVTHRSAVVPLKEICELLMNTEYIGAGICVCRRQGDIQNVPCKAPQNNCLVLGESAKFAIERGFVKRITAEDAVKRMEEADRAGLIHSYSNDPDHYINLLCNCCQCHCRIIRSIKNSPVPGQIITARYLITIDEDSCTAREACVERCQMESLPAMRYAASAADCALPFVQPGRSPSSPLRQPVYLSQNAEITQVNPIFNRGGLPGGILLDERSQSFR